MKKSIEGIFCYVTDDGVCLRSRINEGDWENPSDEEGDEPEVWPHVEFREFFGKRVRITIEELP